MSPKISIIIPTYKPKDYIWTCLDSLCSQTMQSKDWEVIVVLNGCKEPWLQELQKYVSTHKNIVIHIIQTNVPGVSNARNIGIKEAQGEYITFIDDDDYVSQTHLEELYEIASPETIAASNTIAFNENHSHIIPYHVETQYRKHAPHGKMSFYIPKKYFGGPCMKLIHRSIIGDTQFNTNFSNGEDSLFMFEISSRMKYIQFTSTQAIYFRRIRSGSASDTYSFIQRLRNATRLICEYSKLYWKGRNYRLSFYITRILGAVHAIIARNNY